MPAKSTWIEEPWIMKVTYTGKVTLQDIDSMMNICVAEADKHPINFIVDFSDADTPDPAIFRSAALRKLLGHDNRRWFAFVGLEGIYRMGAQLLMRFTSFKSFNTEEEAVTFLTEMVEHQKVSEPSQIS